MDSFEIYVLVRIEAYFGPYFYIRLRNEPRRKVRPPIGYCPAYADF